MLEQEDQDKAAGADRERNQVCPAIANRLRDSPQAPQRTFDIDRKAENLRQLADQNGQCDAVHVAIANRFRQKLGDKAQPRDTG
jgi:hypothetical protein